MKAYPVNMGMEILDTHQTMTVLNVEDYQKILYAKKLKNNLNAEDHQKKKYL